jgi:hypothetical protein
MSVAPPKPPPPSSERLAGLLDGLDLSPFQKELLRQRWLDQLSWVSKQARYARTRHYLLRLPVVIGGVAIPGLISITLVAAESREVEWLPFLSFEALRATTFGVSLLVAILAALEEVFHFGERWRHYRRTSERLKSLGWQFLILNGAFRRHETHASAFTAFTEQVENVLTEDVEGYLGAVASESGDRARHEVVT